MPARSGPLSVLPDIRKAKTLHKAFYLDETLFERSKEKIFAPSWQFIGDAAMLDAGNNVHPFTLFDGFMSEPLMLTLDQQGALHCLSNVCTHRGNLVAAESCRAASLRCPYHGRTFGLDGRFRSMPEFKAFRSTGGDRFYLFRLPEKEVRRKCSAA
jgi:choline monooxygenase